MFKTQRKPHNTNQMETLRIDHFTPTRLTSKRSDDRKRDEYFKEFQIVYRDVLTDNKLPKKKALNYDMNTLPVCTPKLQNFKRFNKEEIKMVRIDVPTFGFEQAIVERRKAPAPKVFKKSSNNKLVLTSSSLNKIKPALSQKNVQAKFSMHNKGEQTNLVDDASSKRNETSKQLQEIQMLMDKRREALQKFSPRYGRVSPMYRKVSNIKHTRPSSSIKRKKCAFTNFQDKLGDIRGDFSNNKLMYKSVDDFFQTVNRKIKKEMQTNCGISDNELLEEDSETLLEKNSSELDYLLKKRSLVDSSSILDEPKSISTNTPESKHVVSFEKPEAIQNIVNFDDTFSEIDSTPQTNRTNCSESDQFMKTINSIKTDLDEIANPSKTLNDVKINRFVDKGHYFDTKSPVNITLKKIDEITKSMLDVDRICKDIDLIKSGESLHQSYDSNSSGASTVDSILNKPELTQMIAKSSYLSKEFKSLSSDSKFNKSPCKTWKCDKTFPELTKRFSL